MPLPISEQIDQKRIHGGTTGVSPGPDSTYFQLNSVEKITDEVKGKAFSGILPPQQLPSLSQTHHVVNDSVKAVESTTKAMLAPVSEAGLKPGFAEAQDNLQVYFKDAIKDDPDAEEFYDKMDAILFNPKLANDPKAMIEWKIGRLSDAIDYGVEKEMSFDIILSMIYMLVALRMRETVKTDQQFITKLGIDIQSKAEQIKDAHSSFWHTTITITAGAISIFGGVAGLAPLASAGEVAKTLQIASQGIGTAGTGLSGIGSLTQNSNEAKKSYLSSMQERQKTREDDRKRSKQSNNEKLSATKQAQKEAENKSHEAVSGMLRV